MQITQKPTADQAAQQNRAQSPFLRSSYGACPYSNVLHDLSVAESLGAVQSKTILYSGGYGYEISAAEKAGWLQKRAEKFVHKHQKDVLWVMEKFGSMSSAQLELVSTIIFVDREAAEKEQTLGLDQLSRQVHEIKPHFSESDVLRFAQSLAKDKLLQATR